MIRDLLSKAMTCEWNTIKSISLVILLSTSVNAAPLVGAAFRDFSGGLNDSTDPTALLPNESPDLKNVIIDEPIGAIKPRGGLSYCGALPSNNTVTAMTEYIKSDGTKALIVTDNENVYQTLDCVAFTRIANGLSSSARPNFSIIRDELWVVNKDTHPFTWDGSTTTFLDGKDITTPIPGPPSCQYLEFWRERVWCARSDSYPSGVQFSAITDSAGNDLSPSAGTLSWPATNIIQVSQEGGSPIYAMRAFRDGLFIFKNNGIWRIDFNNDFDISVVKTLSSVGTRFNDSISEGDNVLYFVGPDGIYSFDGDNAVRISGKITEKFYTMAQPTVNQLYKTWSNTSDFTGGVEYPQIDTGTTNGSLLLGTTIWQSGDFEEPVEQNYAAGSIFVTDGGTWTVKVSNMVIETFDGSKRLGVKAGSDNFSASRPSVFDSWSGIVSRKWSIQFREDTGSDFNDQIMRYMTTSTDSVSVGFGYYLYQQVRNGLLRIYRVDNGVGTIILNKDGSHGISGEDVDFSVIVSSYGRHELFKNGVSLGSVDDTTYTTSSGTVLQCNYGSTGLDYFDNFEERIYYASSTWTSDIFNAVSVSSWGTLGATYDSNGSVLTFQYRAGPNEATVNANTFQSVAPGAIISTEAANIRIQVRVQSSNPGLSEYPQLDDVTVNYSQGGFQSQSIYSAFYKNRYYISAATGSSQTNNLVLVKSRSPLISWVPYDWNVSAMKSFNDVFYVAASTFSGIYIAQSGTNDAGIPIDWYWTSRDEVFGQPLNRKELLEIGTDFRRATGANTVNVGYSRDQGVTFTNSSFSMAGTGRDTDIRYVNGQNSYDFRLRFGSTSIDVAPTIIGITGWVNIYPGRH